MPQSRPLLLIFSQFFDDSNRKSL